MIRANSIDNLRSRFQNGDFPQELVDNAFFTLTSRTRSIVEDEERPVNLRLAANFYIRLETNQS